MNTIDQIINKYLQGESSRDEEQQIADYLEGNDVQEEHRDLIPLFAFFSKERELVTDIDLNKSFESLEEDPAESSTAKVFSLSRTLRSLAAVMLLAFGAYFAFQYIENADPGHKAFAAAEIEDPEEALQVTLEALSFLSKKLDSNTRMIREEMTHADSDKLLN